MNNFQLIHNYRKLARQSLVEDLVCPDDKQPYVVRIGEDEEPVLQCYTCNSVVVPGLRVYDRLRAVLSEFMDVND